MVHDPMGRDPRLKTIEVEQMPWSNNELSMYYDYCHIGQDFGGHGALGLMISLKSFQINFN